MIVLFHLDISFDGQINLAIPFLEEGKDNCVV